MLAGHIWVDKQVFLRENMKYLCPKVLQGMIAEQQVMIQDIMSKVASDSVDMSAMAGMRKEKAEAKEKLKLAMAAQTPLKWVDRVIMWCADKMPSFTSSVSEATADECVKKALAAATDVVQASAARKSLIEKYSS